MRLLFDADGVLFDFMSALCEYINTWPDPSRNLSRDWHPDHFNFYHWHDMMNDHELDVAKCSQMDVNFLRRVKPYVGASQFITAVREKGHDIRIVTAYGVRGHEERARQLVEHFDVPERHIIFCSAEEKRYVRGDALIEDHEDTVRQWALEQKKSAFIVDRPWSRTHGVEYTTANVTRLQKLEDLLFHV